MLSSIYIENIALIKKLNIDLENGLTVITGETGVGKSIIIDSLSLLCGARSDKDIIRTGADHAFVEGVFSVDSDTLRSKLEDMDIDMGEEETLYISRKITAEGKSSAKINGRSIPVSKLKETAMMLLNIHGQQDTQSLSDTGNHIGLLDEYAGISEDIEAYKKVYGEYRQTLENIENLKTEYNDKEQRLEMLDFQINELEKTKLAAGEEELLESEKKQLVNAEKIIESVSGAYEALMGGDSAGDRLNDALHWINRLKDIVDGAEQLAERLESCRLEITDIAETILDMNSIDQDNPQKRIDYIEGRLMSISRLKNKYNTDVPGLIEKLTLFKQEKENIEFGDKNIEEQKKKLDTVKKRLRAAAEALSEARSAAAVRLEAEIENHLKDLDMPSVRFIAEKRIKDFGPKGTDDIEFLITPNIGEEPKPMAKIASGGELSRIMLSVKSAFAGSGGASTVIFDEIDTGISGKTSEKIGLKLKGLANGNRIQILCVTHSAQIAAVADRHLLITKDDDGERTYTNVRELDHEGRIRETARIMGGISITEAILKAAEELINNIHE